MDNCKHMSTPLSLNHSLYNDPKQITEDDHKKVEHLPFRELIGSLLYLSTRTRPDISTAVSMLSKFVARPGKNQWRDLQHLIRYIKGSENYGLSLHKGNLTNKLEAWCDADWARDCTNRRSRTGYLITFNGNPVLWKSKLQTSTALSTSEADFY